MTLPILPGLGATDATEPTTPKLDFRKALLPALGAVALGGQGGGAFIRAFLQGQMAKLEREERDVEKRAAAQEKKDALRRDFLLKASSALAEIDTPEEHEETKTLLKETATILGLDPAVLDVYAYPESKRKRVKQQRAASVFEQLIKTGRFFEEATYEVDGEKLSGRELMILAGVPRGTRKVTEPVTEEIDVPRAEEGGLSRFLAPAGRRAVQVGTRERDEEIPFTTPRRLTLGEAYPEVFAKSGREHWARLPVPLDKDGFPDTVKIAELMAKAGVQNPLEATKRGEERIEKDRVDFDRRLDSIQQQMNQANTEEQFRAAVQGYNRLVEDFRRFKPWVGVKQVPLDIPSAVAQWRQQNKKAGEGGATETQARIKAGLMADYLAGKDIGPRAERILFGTAGEEIIPVRDREILRLWRDNIDPISGEFKDAALAERLKPSVDRIVDSLLAQPGAPSPQGAPGRLTPEDEADIRELAKTKTWNEVAAALRQVGITDLKEIAKAKGIYDAQKKRTTAPPPARPTVRPSTPIGANPAEQQALEALLNRPRPQRPSQPPRQPAALPPAPSRRVADLLRQIRQGKQVTAAEWQRLTMTEQTWLMQAGVAPPAGR